MNLTVTLGTSDDVMTLLATRLVIPQRAASHNMNCFAGAAGNECFRELLCIRPQRIPHARKAKPICMKLLHIIRQCTAWRRCKAPRIDCAGVDYRL